MTKKETLALQTFPALFRTYIAGPLQIVWRAAGVQPAADFAVRTSGLREPWES